MKSNHGKCHLLLSTQENANIQKSNTTIKCWRSQDLLQIVFDNKLKFDEHIENICQKTNRKKQNALAKVTSYMELPERRILMNAFFKSQFSYCSDIWIFYSRSLNNEINRLLERCLRIIYNDECSSFEELLVKVNSATEYHNNIYALAIEMFKLVNGISQEIMNKVFKLREETHYYLRHSVQFLGDPIHSVRIQSNP